MSEKINVEIKTDYDGSDAKRAISDAEKLEQLDPEIEIKADTSELDEVKTKGQEMAESIRQAAVDIDAEIRGTVVAVDALTTALGDTAAKMDVATVVANLQKTGLTLDDIKLDADQLATALKFADDLDTGRVNAGLESTAAHIDKVSHNADQSRSVLANMAGNTTQTMFADLGGVAGDAGVAIGQLAEYAVDGNIALSNLAQIAGPMAALTALSLGVKAVQGNLKALGEQQRQYTEDLTTLKDAFIETGDVAQVLDDQISGNVLFDRPADASLFQRLANDLPLIGGELEEQRKLWEDVADPVKNLMAALDNAGISFNDIADAATEGGDGMARLRIELAGLATAGTITEEQFEFLDEQLSAYQESLFATEKQTEITGRVMTSTATDITDAWGRAGAEAGHQNQLWSRLLKDIGDGVIDTQHARDAWNQLRDELHLTEPEMVALTQSKLADKVAADGKAAEEAAAQVLEMRDSIDKARQAGVEYNQVVSSQEWGATSIEAARTAMTGYFDQFMAATDHVADLEAAYDDLDTALTAADEAGISWSETLFDMNSSESRQARSALREIGDQLIPDIQQAYDDADGDQTKFADNMHDLAEKTLAELQERLGLSTDEVNALAQQLGLVPENVQTMYDLIGQEEAMAQLGLLQGVIATLSKPVQQEITMLIRQGDYVGAMNALEAAVAGGVTTPLYLDTRPALEAFWAIQGAIRLAGIAASLNVSTNVSGAAASSSSASAAPVNVTMYLPRGTRPDDMVRSLDRWTRRNGRSRATRR